MFTGGRTQNGSYGFDKLNYGLYVVGVFEGGRNGVTMGV